MNFDPAAADHYARRWTDLWNRRDLPGVLALFAEHARFSSPKAAAIAGRGTLEGKPALQDYWGKALERIGTLQFDYRDCLVDAQRRTLTVRYVGHLNGAATHACEIWRFGAGGLIEEGEAYYGAPV